MNGCMFVCVVLVWYKMVAKDVEMIDIALYGFVRNLVLKVYYIVTLCYFLKISAAIKNSPVGQNSTMASLALIKTIKSL